ncbi:hypothetical protein RRG08_011660 [Elysia crispata]|uniref:Uncharacterized protein n=1 Tax=Elysia crispata TaxID=231223 RepID=A0AAE0YKC4_9GAST|nr:hypothetical protein RRG08_011660 [Elysia crispata]
MTRQHLHFMLPGHTKFAPDWCFGLLKKPFRITHVSCLSKLSDCVKASTRNGINILQLVGDEKGNILVLTYDRKAELIAEQNRHLMFVTTERFFYQSCVEDSKRTAKTLGITMLEPSPICSKPIACQHLLQ